LHLSFVRGLDSGRFRAIAGIRHIASCLPNVWPAPSVYTENFVRIDYVAESLRQSGDHRSGRPQTDLGAVQTRADEVAAAENFATEAPIMISQDDLRQDCCRVQAALRSRIWNRGHDLRERGHLRLFRFVLCVRLKYETACPLSVRRRGVRRLHYERAPRVIVHRLSPLATVRLSNASAFAA
jgi:hypothetical protein